MDSNCLKNAIKNIFNNEFILIGTELNVQLKIQLFYNPKQWNKIYFFSKSRRKFELKKYTSEIKYYGNPGLLVV